MTPSYELRPVGRVVEGPRSHEEAPTQGREGKVTGVVEIEPEYLAALEGLKPGQWVWVLFWFDRAERDRLKVHPRGDKTRPQAGVFSLRSQHRPNPIALDLARLASIEGTRLTLEGLDALKDTPVLDIKPYRTSLDRPPEAPAG